MKLDSVKKRALALAAAVWVGGWFLAYFLGGFHVLNRCKAFTPDYPCEYEFKIGGFIFFAFVLPLVLYGAWRGVVRIWAWVAKGV